MIYIHKNIGFWQRDKILPQSFKTGTTLEDYNNGAYLLLNTEQEKFYTEYSNATQIECWNMELAIEDEQQVDSDPVETAKRQKLWLIDQYDKSVDVNAFTVNGVVEWLSPDIRSNYKNSIEAAELLGEENITFVVAGIIATIPLQDARVMLAKIQRYADKCTIVTEKHKANIEGLSTVQEIEDYDYKIGYPEKEEFTISN